MAAMFKNQELAERYLLTAIINGTIKPSECELTADVFLEDAFRRIFRAAEQIERDEMGIDMVTVIDRCGMDELVMDLATDTGASSLHHEALRYAGIVRENARRRETARVLSEAAKELSSPDASASSVCLTACDRLRAIISTGSTVETRSMLELVCEALDAIERKEKQPRRVPTGVSQIDGLLGGGFKPTNFVVIGARPGVGKSALMLSMAISAASQGRKVLYISLEMSDEENAQRTMTHISGIGSGRLLHEKLTDKENMNISEGMEAYGLENIEHYEASVCRVSDIRNMAVRMKDRQGLDMVCIDYVGLLRPEQSLGNRVNEIGQITRDLKALAMETGIVVVAAAQLNRESVKSGRPPALSDLRDSGSIEQDANVIIFLHEDGGQDQFGGRRVDIILAKNRQGQRGVVKAVFRPSVTRFAEI